MSCVAGCRQGSGPALLWLWCRLTAAALIQPLVWELPYALGVAIKKKKKKKKEKKKKIVHKMQILIEISVYFDCFPHF